MPDGMAGGRFNISFEEGPERAKSANPYPWCKDCAFKDGVRTDGSCVNKRHRILHGELSGCVYLKPFECSRGPRAQG